MMSSGRIVLGGLLLLAALVVQATRWFWESSLPWLPPATMVITWICLLTGTALITSTRTRRDHDRS